MGELPCDIPSSSGRQSTAEALVADAVDEEQIDSVICVPSFKHMVEHAVSHETWKGLLTKGMATQANSLGTLLLGGH